MKNSIVKESWKPVCGYEGKYEVSDLGRVRSLNYNQTGKTKVLSPGITSAGYLHVVLCKDGKQKNSLVHTLVFWAFNGPIPPGMTVDHINSDKRDNRPENLQLLTRENNTRKAHLGKKCSGETKLRMSAAKKGNTPWNKGKKLSGETKAKMSAAAKARWSGIKNH